MRTNAKHKRAGNPIVYVTEPWQDLCGFTYKQAVNQNPRITQGRDSDPHAIRSISHALGEERACKVMMLNYRGGEHQCHSTARWLQAHAHRAPIHTSPPRPFHFRSPLLAAQALVGSPSTTC